MPSPGWVEETVAEIPWDELPMEWLLDPTGFGQTIAYSMGEGVLETNLGMAPDPGWAEHPVTAISWTEQPVTSISWTEIQTDA